jgi:hypothetical protein
MSEKLLKFLLTELKMVRIICKNKDCGAVVELPVDRLENSFKDFKCPLCREGIRDQTNREDPFDLLGRAIRKFNEPRVREHIEVEFVLPERD